MKATIVYAPSLSALASCSRWEPAEHALARSQAAFQRRQIASLERTIGHVEGGEITTAD